MALQELDECDYWLELLIEAEIVPEAKLKELRKEINELISIFLSAVKKVKRR